MVRNIHSVDQDSTWVIAATRREIALPFINSTDGLGETQGKGHYKYLCDDRLYQYMIEIQKGPP